MKHLAHLVSLGWLAACVWVPGPLLAQSARQSATPEQIAFFEKRIRPVLVKECYSCHSKTARKVRGGLMLDTRAGLLKGGDTGPAIIPGNSRRSLLIQAIRHVEKDLTMPPKKKLPAAVIADFEKWIAMGAPDPRGGTVKITRKEIDIEKGRKYWAFQPPTKVRPPKVKDGTWPRSDIDRFLLARLESRDLQPVADADVRTLVRRVYFDLIGLPPKPEEVEAFVKDARTSRHSALERVVDRLLASPRFGERWGRHWLDVARYAESSGRSVNISYPHAWRYRDYVVEAFNADKPYDQFILEQLAGDLLPSRNPTQRANNLIATGFLAIGPKSHDERSRRQFQMDLVDEQIDVTFQAFQALTVACARCHDHKFDPIPQKDYYAVAGIFQSTETCYGTVRIIQSNHPSSLIELPREAKVTTALRPLSKERRESIERQMDDQRKRMSEMTGRDNFIRRIFMANRITLLRSQLGQYEADGTPRALAMGVREGRFTFDGRLYIRGELDQPGERIERGFPQVLTRKQPDILFGSGRAELASWLASRKNPLTARVMVNRIWLHLMGRGLVATPDNLGSTGQRPSHPALLDYLAVSFMDEGWSIKKMIRTIVLSRAYQLSSKHSKANFEVDPDNVLVWRIPERRLEAEAIRDTMLLLGGKLSLTPPRGSSVAYRGEGRASMGFGFGMMGRSRFRGRSFNPPQTRSVYLPIVRDQLPEILTLFDFPDPSLIIGERATTTVPAQSLFMLNNNFVIQQAEGLADRLLAMKGDEVQQVKWAYQLCYSRPPSLKEIKTARKFLQEYGREHSRRATWTALCQALFAGVEFCHR